MNSARRRRLFLVLALLAAAGVAVALVTLALQQNLTYLYTPTQVHEGVAGAARFRLGGEVCDGSIERTPGTLKVRFDVTDRVNALPVRYEGILPDLFREGQSIVATGRMQDGEFVAEQILAKHDETYMPKEVADAMAQALQRPENSGCPVR